MDAKTLAFWNLYKSHADIDHDEFSIAEFGDSPELADHLAERIKRGVKTATSRSYQAYIDENAALPKTGEFSVVLNSTGDPVCIYQIIDVRIGSFDSADAGFAFAEGEDDRSLESWRTEHRRFFGLSSPMNLAAEKSFMVVFERFRLVWPAGETRR